MGRVNNEIFQFSVPFKQRDVSQMERVVSSLNQDLLPTKEWKEFLISYKNKLQIVNLLVDYAKSGRIRDKVVIVDQGSGCFFKEYENDCVCFPKLDSLHREADLKILTHAVYVGRENNDIVYVVADDADIYLNLINISHHIRFRLYFRQGKTKV